MADYALARRASAIWSIQPIGARYDMRTVKRSCPARRSVHGRMCEGSRGGRTKSSRVNTLEDRRCGDAPANVSVVLLLSCRPSGGPERGQSKS